MWRWYVVVGVCLVFGLGLTGLSTDAPEPLLRTNSVNAAEQGSDSGSNSSGATCARPGAGKQAPFLDPVSAPAEPSSKDAKTRSGPLPLDREVSSETNMAVFGMG